MQSLSVQALTLRQLGKLNSLHLLARWHGPSAAAVWCPWSLHARQLWGSAPPNRWSRSHPHSHRPAAQLLQPWDGANSWTLQQQQQTRHKSSKKKDKHRRLGQQEEEEEDDDEDASDYEDELQDDPHLPKDYRDHEKVVQSLRYDAVLKAGLDVARQKIEDAFYDGKLRLNGQKLIKKSKTVKVGDALDLIMGEDKEDDKVVLKRVIFKKILGETKDADKLRILVRSWKHMQLPKNSVYKE